MMPPLKMVRSLVLEDTTTTTSRFPTHNPCGNDADEENPNPRNLSSGENGSDEDDDNNTHHYRHRRRSTTRTRRRGTTTTSRRKTKTKTKTRTPSTMVESGTKTPFLLFTPTRELIHDTYRLSAIARDIGMDLYPNSSLSHIIFSWPSSPIQSTHNNTRSPHITSTSSSSSSAASTSTPSSSSYRPSFSSSTTSTSPPLPLSSLPDDAIPLPFPTLTLASISLLRYFVSLSKGLFKLVFVESGSGDFLHPVEENPDDRFSSWDCSSLSLMSRATGCRVETMDEFSRVLAGCGWTMFKTGKKVGLGEESSSEYYGTKSAYLFRRVDPERIRAVNCVVGGVMRRNCSRIRELRLPPLDFMNVPLRILQYIVLMTENVFILA